MTRQVLHAIIIQVNHQKVSLDIFDAHHGRMTLYSKGKTCSQLIMHTHAGDLISYTATEKNGHMHLSHGQRIAQPHKWIRTDLHFFSTLIQIIRTTTYRSNPEQQLFGLLKNIYQAPTQKITLETFKHIVLCKALWTIGIVPKPTTTHEKKAFSLMCQPIEKVIHLLQENNQTPNINILHSWTQQCLDVYYTSTQARPITPFVTIPGTQ